MEDEQRSDDLDLGSDQGGAGQAEDPLAGVAAEPVEDVSSGPEEERLGGSGAAIGEEPEPGDFIEEPPESEREPHASEGMEPPPAEGDAAAPAAEEPSSAEPAAEEGAGGVEEKTAEEPAKPKAKKAPAKGTKTPPREYKVLRITGDVIESPLKAPVKARNGDDAIKEAYKALASNAEETMTLVAIPTGYYKVKEVKGREKKDYAVEVK